MLSRLASRASYGWLFAGGLVAGVAMATAMGLTTKPAPTPTYTCREPVVITQRPATCSPENEMIRATAVIHFFDNEIYYATADDQIGTKAEALLALPMMCTNSDYSYPALSRHIESAATYALQRGDKQMVRRLVEVGRAYDVDARMLDSLESAIVR